MTQITEIDIDMADNITRPHKGLHKDSSKQDQPKDSLLFTLNAVNETELGDFNFISNEESNEICDSLTPGFIPLGKIYIGDNELAVLSVSKDDTISEIGILDNNCNYTVHVNDEDSPEEDKLNFKTTKQIGGIYRLRRGCEKTIYFTDDNQRPRYFNFSSPKDFQNNDGTWNAKLFSLQKQYSKIPNFQSVETLDSGGNLEPGAYNIAIQYVDDSLNPTEWITSSPTIKIYNDLSNKEYREINGSINSDTDYLDFPTTSKAIKVTLSNLDSDFLYYRLAFIESNNGSGQVNDVKYSNVIPTSKNFFIYTGSNALEKGTEEEIALFSDIIHKAQSIQQVENKLILGNTQGKQVNFCKLQQYASRIKADVITKQVILSDINDPSNPKNPTFEFGGTGYMPGEIYSFGIVYIFEDGSTSPVYHIPGKSPDINPSTIFSPGDNVHPMAVDNLGSSTYIDNDNCGTGNYWGRDSEGLPLVGKKIRHHRFPLRSEINKPLVTDEIGDQQNLDFYNLTLIVGGDLKTPVACPDATPDCGTDVAPSFSIRVSYKVDGEDFFFIENIDPAQWADGSGSYVISDLIQNGQFHGSNNMTDVVIEVSDINGDFQLASSFDHSIYWNNTPTYTTEVRPFTSTVQGRIYTTEILGIKFSGVDTPLVDDTNGEKVVGYYIVRNERTEFDKTILDTGVLIPSVTNSKYISHGLLAPDTDRISDTVYGLIHPEHKFKGKEYVVYDELIQQGNFDIVDRKYGKVIYNDVYDGSSYDSDSQKGGNDDGHGADGQPRTRGFDGWSAEILSRDNIVSYKTRNNFTFTSDDIEDRFYLDALESRSINDNANDVYNITTDNKVGMIHLKDGVTVPGNNRLPYVVMKKNNLDPYSNFRVLPYYKDTVNPFYFDGATDDIATVFGGDSHVMPMKYVNSTFWDNRVARRKGRSSVWTIILGAVLAVVGAVLAIFTAGASTLLIGAGIALIGAGALFISSGIKMDNVNRAYNEEYDKGLRQTTLDNWVDAFYNYRNNAYTQTMGFSGNGGSGHDGPTDDTIQWIGDCITDLWFESTINANLRNHFIADTPTYLDSPGKIESGNDTRINTWEFFGINYTDGNQERYPVSSLERHLSRKLLAFDETRNDNRYYIGLALGEYYHTNPDYERFNKQKIYSHLPLEYDCCSDCQEDFPHRWHWSEESFQEELSDNFRVFLPNNYKDISGDTGEITNVFIIGNNLFIHTREALWQIPRNYQERITDQIVSFIGTGEYGATPAQKILDDDTGSSAGLQHKWSAIKTPSGYFFVSENQKKLYQFDGRKLKPISSVGLSNWFKENTELMVDRDYYNSTGEKYPYRDNPSNPFGSGFISTYDSKKERIIFTKKDFAFTEGVIDNGDFEICIQDGQVILFENFNQIIEDEAVDGWMYEGIEDCKMKFEKITTETVQEEREIVTTVVVPPDTIVIPFFDTTSMTASTIDNISATIDAWFPGFKNSVNGGVNNLTLVNPGTWNRWGTEDWLEVPQIALNNVGVNQDVLLLVFVDETNGPGTYHGGSLTNPMAAPTTGYISDVNTFVNTVHSQFASFKAINYPIQINRDEDREYLQHAIAAIEARDMTQAEVDALSQNANFDATQWGILKANLMNNPYVGQPILRDYGWLYKEDRVDGVDNNGSAQCPIDGVSVITPCQFTIDVEELLQGTTTTTTETIIVDVIVETIETKYVEGVVVDDPIQVNGSWTISYSLKTGAWVSWHSYLPNFYMNIPEKFYSWINGNDNIWKHNKRGHYQTFYGKLYPHIVEYVSLANPLITKIWDYLRLQTEAKQFDEETNEYVDKRFITFNKAILHNSRQCSGMLDLIVKDTEIEDADYLMGQVINDDNSIIDRNERDWTLNNFRDIRTNYNVPIWNSNINSIQNEYFIDKILNELSLDKNKDWTQLESFRDKYLVVRLIFDKFADIKLITNYSVENEQQSHR